MAGRLHTCASLSFAALMLLHSAPANATTVNRQNSTVTLTTATGENNGVEVGQFSGVLDVIDFGPNVTLTAGAGCTSASAREATCATAGVTAMSVSLGDGDDRFSG